MVQQQKKSPVQLLNSWRPFVEVIRGALKTRDYRKETVCGILRTFDIEVSTWPGSIFRYVSGAIIGSGFFLGRNLLYGDVFRRFLEQNRKAFKGAPLVVIQEFNRLVRTLFSEGTAKRFLLEESIARRRLTREEKILAKRKRSMEHLTAFVRRLQAQELLEPQQEKHVEVEEEEHADLIFERKRALFTKKPALDQRTITAFEKLYADGIEIDDQLIALVEEEGASFSKFVQNAQGALPKLSFGAFQDLHKALRELGSVLYFDEKEVTALCSSGKEERKLLIDKKVREMTLPFESIMEHATRLKNDIDEIEKEMLQAKAILAPFMKKKDTRARVEILLNELALLNFKESILAEKTSVIEKTVAERRKKVKELLASFRNEFFELLSHLQKLEEESDKIKLNIVHARWEIFSRHTPFSDLSELIDRVEHSILSTLSQSDEDLIVGEKSFDEIRGEMLDSLYTHNVKLVRWELLSRALRLKDIRGEVEKELLALDRKIGLLKLSGDTPEDILKERAWLYSFFEKLLAPHEIFKDTCDPESINVLFRYFWIDLDRFRAGKERRSLALDHAEEHAQALHAFKIMQEIMEKISFGKTISPNNLKAGIEAWLEKNDDEFALLPFIAANPYGKKEEFLRRVKELSERKKRAEKLARAVQAAKTFEPERIDALLEAFTLLRFSKNPFEPLEERFQKIEAILEKIEEAIYCEIGLTDVKSRMEAGYALNELIKEAKISLPEALKMVKKLLEKTSKEKNFVGNAALFLLEEADVPLENVFEAARSISLLFFQNRLAVKAAHHNSFARPVLLFTMIRKTLSFLSKTLEQEKSSKLSELFTFSRKLFNLIFPQLSKEELLEFLREFSKRARIVAGDVEIPILSELELIEKELENIVSWDIPIVSFVPGDMKFFLE